MPDSLMRNLLVKRVAQAELASLAKRLEVANATVRNASAEKSPSGELVIRGERGHQGELGPQGEAGPKGARGPQGEPGPKGERGPQGETGPKGEPGPQGAPGLNGNNGQDGAAGEMPAHEWVGTKLRFKTPAGKWGKSVDLQGSPGNPGKTVVLRGGSASSMGLESLMPGDPDAELTGIAVMQAGQWVQFPWLAFISAVAGAVDMGSELSRRSDFVGETIIYRGEAVPGASESSPVWRIKRIEFVSGDVIEKWANGTADFDKQWDARGSLNYV